MTTPNEPTAEQVATPTVSTAPSGGAAPDPGRRWWHWDTLPDHLGRARTSTVILSVLFLAVFALYLNVRPDDGTARTTPAGGGSDVESPLDPFVPSEPTPEPSAEPTGEPTPTTGTGTPEEESGTPTTGSPTPSTTAPGTGSATPTGTADPAEPTSGTTDEGTPATTSPATP